MTSSVQQMTDAVGGSQEAPNPVRWSFTAEYRAQVVAQYEAAPHGEKAGVLRREGLYQSQVREWRAEPLPARLDWDTTSATPRYAHQYQQIAAVLRRQLETARKIYAK